ncbi:transposase [Skermanella mucosa]|uniref:transposase n=1 Tax=Skermanella mucosa TaxID=1789672 RepID=UPI001E31D72F|nr:transposase [Skermanella mucosa]UEM20207.1 transposase [Skermanella mucosa]
MDRPDPPLPEAFCRWLAPALAVFSPTCRPQAAALAVGALLALGPRTVAGALRALGLAGRADFATFHRVLSRDVWSGLALARRLTRALVRVFALLGPVVVGLDHTLERRRGPRVRPAAHYYDPVRSSRAQGHQPRPALGLGHAAGRGAVRPQGLGAADAQRAGAEPSLLPGRGPAIPAGHGVGAQPAAPGAALAAGARHGRGDGRRVRLGRPAARVGPRNDRGDPAPPGRPAVRLPAPRPPGRGGRPATKGKAQTKLAKRRHDAGEPWQRFALLVRTGRRHAREAEFISGTALWHHPGEPPVAVRWILVRYPGSKRDPDALACTDLTADPLVILGWFSRRWLMELTYEEARAHLGVETQRQHADKAVFRTTPVLFGLYSLVALHVQAFAGQLDLTPRRAAWYPKTAPTFADALAAVRIALWTDLNFVTALDPGETVQIPRTVYVRLVQAAAYAP